MKIFYLEDDTALAETIVEFLEESGYEVVLAEDYEEALDILYEQNFDLLILDVQVPSNDESNGFDLLNSIREAGTATPAIFTTSRDSIEDLSTGYESGADDYLRKPFLLKELLLRVQALTKREFNNASNSIELSTDVSFDLSSEELTTQGQNISLNQKEKALLKLFIKHSNEIVSFETIFNTVWSYEENHSEMSLRTYIKHLRKILGKERIISIKKVGYKFV
jgi:DNA-binding response OmpR family regulator